jgi:exosortase/archaeosortase family protein
VADASSAHGLSPARIAVFAGVFAVLQMAWQAARDGPLGSWVISKLLVQPVTWSINRLSPGISAQATDDSILASGAGLRILNGCEGVEAWILLVAMLLAAKSEFRHRIRGIAAGTLFVLLLNQLRVLGLFYANRADRSLFDMLHGMVMPAATALAVLAFGAVWHRAQQKSHA